MKFFYKERDYHSLRQKDRLLTSFLCCFIFSLFFLRHFLKQKMSAFAKPELYLLWITWLLELWWMANLVWDSSVTPTSTTPFIQDLPHELWQPCKAEKEWTEWYYSYSCVNNCLNFSTYQESHVQLKLG